MAAKRTKKMLFLHILTKNIIFFNFFFVDIFFLHIFAAKIRNKRGKIGILSSFTAYYTTLQ